MSQIDCNSYNESNCPKGTDLINKIDKNALSFITFGCWGVYCLDGKVKLEKGNKT